MLRSLRIKIFALVLVILALVAGLVILSTRRDVERAMFESEERAARNVLHLVELNIEGRYKSLLQSKIDAIGSRKAQLSDLSRVVILGLDEYRRLAAARRLSAKAAREAALSWLSALRLGDEEEYFFVYDAEGRAVAYPDPAMRGTELGKYRDLKGRSVVAAMRQESMAYGQAFDTYTWKALRGDGQVKQFGLFSYYAPWDWVVAAAVPIEGLERDIQKTLDEIVGVLGESMSQIRIARSGYVFLFDGKKRVLIPPAERWPDVGQVRNSLSGNLLLDDLMAQASKGRDAPLTYLPAGVEAEPRPRESFVVYFKALDWYIASTAFADEIRDPARALVNRQILIVLGVLVVGLGLAFPLASRISNPLKRLAEYAKALPGQDFSVPPPADSPLRDLPGRSRDEVGRLAEAFVFMEQSLRQNILRLMETTAAKERIESELKIAHDIQMGILPKVFPPFPERREFDLFAALEPAKQVGGDLYTFFFVGKDRLCVAVGDVSDKGVPAALFMAVTITLLKGAADRGLDPAAMMTSLNDALSRDNPNCMFVTLFIGVLDVSTGVFSFANGGHNPPVLLDPDKDPAWVKDLSGPVVAAIEDVPYAPRELRLAPGQVLFLYTDGVTEAMSPAGAIYTEERLLEVLAGLKAAAVEGIVSGVMADVNVHAAGAPRSDDITMLCLRYRGVSS